MAPATKPCSPHICRLRFTRNQMLERRSRPGLAFALAGRLFQKSSNPSMAPLVDRPPIGKPT
jgi:hypothetical protein